MSFASRSWGLVAFGFAAGCEAVAMPRRRGAFYIFGLGPWCGLWPNKSEGLSPNQGHSPGNNLLLSAGHSHRRTSGGKAEAPPTEHSQSKAEAMTSGLTSWTIARLRTIVRWSAPLSLQRKAS